MLLYLFSGIGSSLAHSSFNHFLAPELSLYHYRRRLQQQQQRQDGDSWWNVLVNSLYKLLVSEPPTEDILNYDYDAEASIGASGAIMGILMLITCSIPFEPIPTFDLFSFIFSDDGYDQYDECNEDDDLLSLPAWLDMTIYLFLDTLSSLTLSNRTVDTTGHIGGGNVIKKFFFSKFKIELYSLDECVN